MDFIILSLAIVNYYLMSPSTASMSEELYLIYFLIWMLYTNLFILFKGGLF